MPISLLSVRLPLLFSSVGNLLFGKGKIPKGIRAVSYTHLDVYKRQAFIDHFKVVNSKL